MAEKTEKAGWNGAFDAFGKMFARMRANPEPAILLVGVYLVLIVIQMNTVGLAQNTWRDSAEVAGFEALFFLFFLLALPTYALALAKGKAISISQFMKFNVKKYLSILAASILYTLAAIGSLLLLIVPAIWVIAWFALFQMAVIEKNMGPIEALKESKRLIANDKGKVWGIIGASILLSFGASLLAIVPLVGDLLSAAATMTVAVLTTAVVASLYRWAR